MKLLLIITLMLFLIASLLQHFKDKQKINVHKSKLENGIYLKEWEKKNNISYQEYVSKGGGTHFIGGHTHYNARR